MKKRYLIAGAYGLVGAALAAKLLSRPRDVRWEEHAGRLPHAERSRFIEVEGVRVHYQEAGASDAPPVVLIHGFCASAFVWGDVLLNIAAMGFRLIAPDLIGFGFSEKPRDGEYTIDAQARMIVRLMDALRIKRAALVGSSYGGAVAASCALDFPERVERLVLVDPVSNDDVKNQTLLRLAASPVMGDLVSPLIIDSRRLMRWRMAKVYADGSAPHLVGAERMRAHHLPLRNANAHRAVLRTLRRWNAGRVEREAHRITQPVLLIWGEDDRDIPLVHGERLHALIPNSRLIVFRGCGHLPQEERPEEFAGLVAGFCKSGDG
ncbi:MAG: alpha/beta hydrolase [Acidobacteriota bacterium]|nr:alpha/beta hydrolase [Acidobacteriota bacterium]